MNTKFLFIPVYGEIKILDLPEKKRLNEFYSLVGCDSIEIVRVVGGHYLMIVDEEGKVCANPKEMNVRASCGYGGYPSDYIAGDVLVGKFNGADDIEGMSLPEARELLRLFNSL